MILKYTKYSPAVFTNSDMPGITFSAFLQDFFLMYEERRSFRNSVLLLCKIKVDANFHSSFRYRVE